MADLSAWSYHKEIVVKGDNAFEALTDFPLCVPIVNDSDLTISQTGGGDIRFTQSDGSTLLSYEIESWTGGNGTNVDAVCWVKTDIATTGALIDLWYGNDAVNRVEDAPTVWNDYRLVMHWPSGGLLYDSTMRDHTILNTGTVVSTGMIGNSRDWDDTGDIIGVNDDAADLDNVDDITISTLANARTQGEGSFGRFLTKGNPYEMRINASDTQMIWHINGDAVTAAAGRVNNQWQHIVGTYERNTLNGKRIYIDGLIRGQEDAADAAVDTNTNQLIIGNTYAQNRTMDGWIDEVRVRAEALSSGWIWFEYMNILSVDNELTWGDPIASSVDVSITNKLNIEYKSAALDIVDTNNSVLGTQKLGTIVVKNAGRGQSTSYDTYTGAQTTQTINPDKYEDRWDDPRAYRHEVN